MKLTLIRHAQSERNKSIGGGHFYSDASQKSGIPNHRIKITEEGEAQARTVARRLRTVSIEKGIGTPTILLHSGYERSKKTAEIILNELQQLPLKMGITLKTTLEQDHLLRERDSGYGIEMTKHESKQHFPYLEDYWELDGTWFAVPPGGESVVQVMDRVSTFLLKLSLNKKFESKHVCAVTHAGTMSAFQMVIEKIPFEKADELVIRQKNCATAEYEYEDGDWASVKK